MKTINLNAFNSLTDKFVNPCPTTWENLVQLFTEGHTEIPTKLDGMLFNLSCYSDPENISDEFKGYNIDGELKSRRISINIQSIDAMVLDYDNQNVNSSSDPNHFSIQDAQRKFKQFEYVLYTSFSHQLNGVDKFRVIIPFSSPIPVHDFSTKPSSQLDWFEIKQSLLEFAGPCDPKSFSLGQLFFMPNCPIDPQHKPISLHNKGKSFDWTHLERNKENNSEHTTISENKSYKTISENELLNLKHGSIRAGDVEGKIQKVFCPFHDDNTPSALAQLNSSGYRHVYCYTCNESFPIVSQHQQQQANEAFFSIDDLLDISIEKSFLSVQNRAQATQDISDIRKFILKNKWKRTHAGYKYWSHLMFMPEGSGKSHLATNLAASGEKIIFACKSWEQALEKYQDFTEDGKTTGFNTQIVTSYAGTVYKAFGIKPVYKPTDSVWNLAKPDEEATHQAIKDKHPNLSIPMIKLRLEFMDSNNFDYVSRHTQEMIKVDTENPPAEPVIEFYPQFIDKTKTDGAIFVTSIEQLRTLKARNALPPEGWLIWIDDPDFDDCIDLKPITEQQARDIEQDIELDIAAGIKPTDESPISIEKHYYAIRNSRYSLGLGLEDYNCIYTTTEQKTREAIELLYKKRQGPLKVHDKMHNVKGGEIIILGTNRVTKKQDALVRLAFEELLKSFPKIILIADGIASDNNHVNSKGKNKLNKHDSIIEISHPHPNNSAKVCHSLGGFLHTGTNTIEKEMMLDQLHQALGRNTGYRHKNAQAIALVPSKSLPYILRNTRYQVNTKLSVQVDRLVPKTKLGSRLPKNNNPLLTKLDELINNPNVWLLDGRKSKPLIRKVMNTISDIHKQDNFLIRLLLLMQVLGHIKLYEPKPQKLNPLSDDYWILCEYLLKTYTTDINHRIQIINHVKEAS